MKLDYKKLGLAVGLTSAMLYIGCALVMIIFGHAGSVAFFNSLLHGLDVSSVIRMDVPLWEAGIGIAVTFALGWMVGACVAGFYNATLKQA